MNKESKEQRAKGEGKTPSGVATFWVELKRRKVMRVAVVYAVVAWLVIQIAATTFPSLSIPGWAFRFVAFILVMGLPLAVIVACAIERLQKSEYR